MLARKITPVLFVVAAVAFQSSQVTAADAAVDRKAIDQAVNKGIEYLRTKGQAADGSYTAQAGPAFTAICTLALLDNGRTADDPQVAKGLKYVEGFVQTDGRICAERSRIPNYETSVNLMTFAAANKDGRYDKIIANAQKFLRGVQNDETESLDKSDISYGGAGYGAGGRSDLSNTAYLLEALEAAGVDGNDEAVKKAMIFVSRCQNLESEHNTLPFAAKNPDGGFIYTPAAGGRSPAGRPEQDEAALRSYGSMTYAGLKSMLYAKVDEDDPRVQAAVKWLRGHFSVTENPGMGDRGLYYYYNTMAKSLAALGEDSFKDSKGTVHDWKKELAGELISKQAADGSWVNQSRMWMEGDPNLCTAFALISLARCK